MEKKEFSGNFYNPKTVEKTPDECPNCLYQKKEVQKDVEDCPNCYYKPNKKQE